MNKKPNILYIMTDQQSAHMMGCAGTKWVDTPNLDKLARKGILFNRAYCSNPVCIPSRFSLFTGRLPEAMGLRSNDFKYLPSCDEKILSKGMGHEFTKGGYDCFYAGKQHFPGYKGEDIGFTVVTNDERDALADAAVDFLNSGHDKPWLFVTSFINPHDICYKAITDYWKAIEKPLGRLENNAAYRTMQKYNMIPDGISSKEFFRNICPPLPANNEKQEDEPGILDEFRSQRQFKEYAAKNYSTEDWRMHRWIYKKLTEHVDTQIGRVLDALETSGYADNTLVIFTSDHGDMDGSHKFEHKTVLYEEAVRIPLIISFPGHLPEGIKTEVLASNGLDLYPSLLEYTGLKVPEELDYVNCIEAALGECKSRSFVPVESEIGRAIVTDDYKYVMYDFGEDKEQLYDYAKDPGEMKNHIGSIESGDLQNQFNLTWSIEQRNKNISPLKITKFNISSK